MKRNRFGVNLDEGIPLDSKEDYEILYVDFWGETATRLISWVEEGDKPLLLGGQIGSGKSTLLNKVMLENSQKPDIILHFDRETLNLDAGDFWSITLAAFIDTALKRNIDLSFCKLPEEISGFQADDWNALLGALVPNEFSITSFSTKKRLRKTIAKHVEYISEVVSNIGSRLQTHSGQPVFILAGGLDKFDTTSAAFIAINDIVATLSNFKTIFEVNAVHLFSKPGSPFHLLDRFFIPTVKEGAVIEMLARRMGVYADPIRKELQALAEWSGGNPRQALRLLTHFESARKNQKRSIAENLAVAIRETTSDFFAYASKPSVDLMKIIKRSKKIGTSLFTLPGDKETARIALYGNWILLDEQRDDATWGAMPNPLVNAFFENTLTPDEPEKRLLLGYAEDYGISPKGLGLPNSDAVTGKEKGADQLLWEFLASGVEEPIHTSLTETLDVLGAALLSKDRADRAIIAFKDHSLIEAARSYLFAKANSYEYQRYKHTVIEGGMGKEPLPLVEEFLSEDTDIYSIEFSGKWDANQLDTLDKHRDLFLSKQILWWIPLDGLKEYLPHWTQLRQLFEIFVLEDELLGSLSQDEIEADLEFFEDLVESSRSNEANLVSNLKKVLSYLKDVRKEVNHG